MYPLCINRMLLHFGHIALATFPISSWSVKRRGCERGVSMFATFATCIIFHAFKARIDEEIENFDNKHKFDNHLVLSQ